MVWIFYSLLQNGLFYIVSLMSCFFCFVVNQVTQYLRVACKVNQTGSYYLLQRLQRLSLNNKQNDNCEDQLFSQN